MHTCIYMLTIMTLADNQHYLVYWNQWGFIVFGVFFPLQIKQIF